MFSLLLLNLCTLPIKIIVFYTPYFYSLFLPLFVYPSKDLWLQIDGIATKCSFCQVIKVSLPNLNDKDSRKRIKKEIWVEGHNFFLLSRPHVHGYFWPFFTIQSQEVEQRLQSSFLFWRFYALATMQKMTISIFKIIYLKAFSKHFTNFKV